MAQPAPFCVTVYASSSSAVDKVFKDAAYALGRAIAQERWVQCNGGGKHGLMRACTDGALAEHGVVDFVIWEKFIDTNKFDGAVRECIVAPTMTERKAKLLQRADALVCLPGGLGTLEEVAEAMSWLQLGIHSKPIVFLNTDGFYDGLWQFYKSAMERSFISTACDSAIFIASTPEEAVSLIKAYRPVAIDKSTIYAGEMDADWTSRTQ